MDDPSTSSSSRGPATHDLARALEIVTLAAHPLEQSWSTPFTLNVPNRPCSPRDLPRNLVTHPTFDARDPWSVIDDEFTRDRSIRSGTSGLADIDLRRNRGGHARRAYALEVPQRQETRGARSGELRKQVREAAEDFFDGVVPVHSNSGR